MGERTKRSEPRKSKRIYVRFGKDSPQYRAPAIQISTGGLFLSTNHPVFPPGSELVIEIDTPTGPLVARAMVRHAKRAIPVFPITERSGMGVKFIDPPLALREYLASL
jgi:hypothetical protein